MSKQFDVMYSIRIDWSQKVTVEAHNAAEAATLSRKALEAEHGKIASRWGVIESIDTQ